MTGRDVELGKAPGSAYGNPDPQRTPALERAGLIGRLQVANRLAKDPAEQALTDWWAVVDELLDHLVYYRERAISQAMDEAEGWSC